MTQTKAHHLFCIKKNSKVPRDQLYKSQIMECALLLQQNPDHTSFWVHTRAFDKPYFS